MPAKVKCLNKSDDPKTNRVLRSICQWDQIGKHKESFKHRRQSKDLKIFAPWTLPTTGTWGNFACLKVMLKFWYSIVFEKVAQVTFDTMQKIFDCILYYIFSLALISSLQIWLGWDFVLFSECIWKRWAQEEKQFLSNTVHFNSWWSGFCEMQF